MRRLPARDAAVWATRITLVATALCIALFLPTVPRLRDWLGSEGWARAAEVVLLIFFIRAALALLGIYGGKFAFLGISIDEGSSAAEEISAVREAQERLLLRIGAAGEAIERAVERLGALEERLEILEGERPHGG